jgi:Beta-lactamase.
VGDLLAFAGALLAHRLLSAELTETILAGKVVTDRPVPGEDRYAYGFADQTINGVRIVGHNGGTPGYEGELNIYPDLGTTVVLLSNQDGALLPALRVTQEILTGLTPPGRGEDRGRRRRPGLRRRPRPLAARDRGGRKAGTGRSGIGRAGTRRSGPQDRGRGAGLPPAMLAAAVTAADVETFTP